jgi:hypothetical protein
MLLAFLLVSHSLMAYGLSGSGVLGGVLIFGIASWFGGAKRALAAAASLAGGTLLLAGIIAVGDLDRSVYPRPHDVLRVHDSESGLKRYVKDATVTMDDVAGDLQGMTKEPIARRRSITFRTDELGFRNDRPFRDQAHLVVGDSFIVGIGNTQEDILTEQLAARYAPDYYNLGYPGDMLEYEEMVASFPATEPDVLLFLFEGNDFPDELESPEEDRRGFLHRYVRMFRDTGMYRLMRTWRKRLEHDRAEGQAEPIRIERTRSGALAFYLRYVEVSERAQATPVPEFEAALGRMADRIRTVFFIPTKYRVYHPVLWPEKTLPNAQWEYLTAVCERLGLRCVDLTPSLVHRSLELWEDGRLTYWPDDSHWNGEGMAVAAAVVHETTVGTASGGASRESR